MPLGHLGINVSDLTETKAYYDRLMPLLGFDPGLKSWRAIGQIDLSNGQYLFFPGEPSWER